MMKSSLRHELTSSLLRDPSWEPFSIKVVELAPAGLVEPALGSSCCEFTSSSLRWTCYFIVLRSQQSITLGTCEAQPLWSSLRRELTLSLIHSISVEQWPKKLEIILLLALLSLLVSSIAVHSSRHCWFQFSTRSRCNCSVVFIYARKTRNLALDSVWQSHELFAI